MRNDGQKIINAMLDRAGIGREYKFKAIESPRELGNCDYCNQTIGVNKDIVSDNDWLDTLLHEIVHAVITERHHCNIGHNKEFKTLCKEFNCSGLAAESIKLDYNYKYTVECSCRLYHRDRLSARKRAMIRCGHFTCSKCHGPHKLTVNR